MLLAISYQIAFAWLLGVLVYWWAFNRSFGMSLADGIIIFVIAIIVIAIIYFQFIRRSYSPCDSCPKRNAARDSTANP